jgi:prepilin-type processing-associated H-X9-DG protein
MKKIKTGCFTLIELLVTLAILMILVSLLQPSLARLFEKSHTLQCQNNLRSFSSGIALYQDDYDGFYPTISNFATLSGKRGNKNVYGARTKAEGRKLNAYLDSEEMSHCPSDKGDMVFDTKYSDFCFDDYGTSYLPASFSNRGGVVYVFGHNRRQSKNIADIDKTSNKFIIADWTWGVARDYKYQENRWHGGVTSRVLNIAFADGHVELIDFTNAYELTKATRRPDKNWLFW